MNEAIQCSLEALTVADKRVTWPLLATIFLAPLCEPLRSVGREPAFILWECGGTGERKSTVTALFMNHYGRFPDGKSLPSSFKDTVNSMEKKAFTLKDSVLVVDDYHPNSNQHAAKDMEAKTGQLFRGYGDRAGRSRMRPEGTLRPTYILCIVTGEDLPKGPLSDHARYFPVLVEKGSVNLQMLTKLQSKAELFGQTMFGYLSWLASEIEAGNFDELRAIFDEVRDKVQTEGMHGRIPEIVACLYIGAMMFLKFAEEKGVVSLEVMDAHLVEAYSLFKGLAVQHAANMVNETPVNQFLNGLRELIASEQVVLIG